MKKNLIVYLTIILLIIFFILSIINSTKSNINIRTNGGTGTISIKSKNNNSSINKSNDNSKNNNIKGSNVNNGEYGERESIDYFLIAIIFLLLATGMTFLLIVILIIYLIKRYRSKNKIIET